MTPGEVPSEAIWEFFLESELSRRFRMRVCAPGRRATKNYVRPSICKDNCPPLNLKQGATSAV